ncbi:MAG TPA: hypothetical protein GXZ59_05750 [Clostridiaceae bacterium]|nr:hypothetical protein [Clostridiaceae bacterium]
MITKVLEEAGIPTVQVCNMVPIAVSQGVNRIYTSSSIKYPFGNPSMPPPDEKQYRLKMAKEALAGLLEENFYQ